MIKYCQGPRCHTYDTTDRKRGPQGNKRNQTRTVGQYGYGNGNFCTLTCQNDWWDINGQRAVDHFGRLHEPKILTEENAWHRRSRWDEQNNRHRYIEINIMTGEEREVLRWSEGSN
tara:strand:+ start:318 stop:665 length:348 start_codon:yes stop_codon:yes gene_type:complete